MAFEIRGNAKTFKKATDMQINESFQGYFMGAETSVKGFLNWMFKMETGQIVSFSPAGNLRYLEGDQALVAGQFTRITKTGTRTSKKNNREVGVYVAEQDAEKTMPMSTMATNKLSAVASVSPEELQERLKAMRSSQG